MAKDAPPSPETYLKCKVKCLIVNDQNNIQHFEKILSINCILILAFINMKNRYRIIMLLIIFYLNLDEMSNILLSSAIHF